MNWPDFKNEVSVGDLIQVGAVLVAAGGLVFSAWQTRRSNKQGQFQQVLDLHGRFLSDAQLVETYYLFEYSKFVYGKEFHGSKLERQVDRLLQTFENMAMCYEEGLVTARELDVVAYHYLVLYQDEELQKYLTWLDGWYKQRGIKEIPFGPFRTVGRILEKRRYDDRSLRKPSSASSVNDKGIQQ